MIGRPRLFPIIPVMSRKTAPSFVRRPRPVAQLLSALVLVCLLPGLVGMAIFLLAEYREERQRYTEGTVQIARSIGQSADKQLLHTQSVAQYLADAGELASGDLDAFVQHAKRAMAVASPTGQVVVYRHDGSRLISYPGAASGKVAPRDDAQAVQRVFARDAAWISNVGTDQRGAPVIGIHVPVRREGKVIYALAMFFPASQLTALLRERALPGGWLSTLLDAEGVVAARNRGAEKFVGQFAFASLRAAITRQPEGSIETTSLDGVPNFTVFARSPQTGYTAIVGVPRSQLSGPLWTRMAYLSATVALLFGLGLLLARFMSRRISRSIHALTEPAAALGRGAPPLVRAVHVSEAVEVATAIERAAVLLQERDAALRAQRDELQQFKFFTEHANEMLLLLDERGNIRYANRMTSERLGYSHAELLSMTLFQIDLPTTPERLQAVFAECRSAQKPPFERVYRCKDGVDIPVEITATVLEHKGEWLMHVVPRDIRERRQAEQAIRWAASHDGLTELANRAQATRFLEEGLVQARSAGGNGALLFVDLDRFKPVNDIYGHDAGDRVLQEVARRLRGCVRHDDLLARVGGDEFLIVLPCPDDSAHPARRAEDIIHAVAQPIRLGNIEVMLSASVGISRFPQDGETASALVHAADMAMLAVKQGGRAGYAWYSAEMGVQAQFTLNVERRLQAALEHGGLLLHYQPVVHLASGRVDGVEALVRLDDGASPAVGPATFVPIAESCGLIAPMGEWVAAEACRQQGQWQAAGLPLSVSVNVSALQFRRSGFVGRIRDVIEATGIAPHCLVIELTETAVMENLAEAIGILNEVRSLGVRVALDDFGTGYSSLSMLSTLPLDKLKIDQSFVRRIDTDHASRAVIDAVIALANSLGLELVAEGIETEAALHYLRERGCQLGQGFYFSRPLPAAQLEEWHAGR